MNVQQKVAWFNLGVFVAALVVYAILVPLIGPLPALGAFGICGAWGLDVFFYWRRKGEVVADERDQLINIRAQLAGLWIFWELFIAACMITWGLIRFYKHQETVPVDVLPALVGGAGVVFWLSHSIATLVQYGRSRGHEG